MKKILKGIFTVLAVLAFCSNALAEERGSRDDAYALVKKAIAYMKANGKEKAFQEFNNPKGQFIDRDLYIFVFDLNTGKNLAHGTNPKMHGKDMMDLRDIDGKYLIREFRQMVLTKGSGWVDYRWINPVTKGYDLKSSYVEKYDDMMIGCGIYK